MLALTKQKLDSILERIPVDTVCLSHVESYVNGIISLASWEGIDLGDFVEKFYKLLNEKELERKEC